VLGLWRLFLLIFFFNYTTKNYGTSRFLRIFKDILKNIKTPVRLSFVRGGWFGFLFEIVYPSDKVN
jgi:hypothetical protein